MPRLRLSGLLAVVIACAQVPFVSAQSAQRPAGGDWWSRATEQRTNHYALKTDLPEADARALAVHMDYVFESYMAMFMKMLPRVQRLPRLELLLCNTEEDYLKISRERFNHDASGSWGTCHTRGNEISLVAFRGRHSTEDMKGLLQHEGFHQVGHILFDGLPTWAHEGLAELFERGAMVGSTLAIGEYSAADKRRVLKALQEKRFLPMERLLAITSKEWGERVRARESSDLYLQVWSLVQCFLFTENGRYERNFLNFLQQLNHGTDWRTAFFTSFRIPDFQSAEQKWEEYLRAAPTTDYHETARRLAFLAAGAAQLDVRPASFDELKAKLQEQRFEHTTQLFGEERKLSAAEAEMFEVPWDDASPHPHFALVDTRGQPVAAAPTARNPKPVAIATVGLTPEMFIARPVARGKQVEYVLSAEPSRAAEPQKTIRRRF